MVVEITRDPRELERAFHHPERCVTVAIHNAIRERAMVRPDSHGYTAFLAKLDKWREPLADPIQLCCVLLVGVLANDEFL